MAQILFVLSVLATVLIPPTNGANILALFPTPSFSHLIIEIAAVNALAERNHNVTLITVLPLKSGMADERMTHIQLKSGLFDMDNAIRHSNVTGYKMIIQSYKALKMIAESNAAILDDPEFSNILHNRENKFDLMLLGYLFNEYFFGVAAHFNCPVALIWPNLPLPNLLNLIGNPHETAHIPMTFAPTAAKSGLKFRMINLLITAANQLIMAFLDNYNHGVYEAHFSSARYPSYSEVKKKVSLLLYCHHFSESPVRSLVPGMIEIGGIQLGEDTNNMPQDISEFLSGAAEHGVIFFSLGTNVRQNHFQDGANLKMFNVLSKLPQKVLWKVDDETVVPGIATNILYKKWLPQRQILAHANTRLFITHGGKGGITEAQYYGVPMLGIPIFGDQPINIDEMVKKGYGTTIDHAQPLTEAIIEAALLETLHNVMYKSAVQAFSRIYRDRPLSAKDSAVFWLEYVMRHEGAPHMQSPLKHMSLIEKHNLDVLLVSVVLICLVFKLIKIVVRILAKKFLKSWWAREKSKTD